MSLPEPLKKELDYGNKILKEFFAESGRSAAVLMGAELDIQLERVLSHFLKGWYFLVSSVKHVNEL